MGLMILSAYGAELPYLEFFEDQDAGTDVDGWRGLSASALSAQFQDTTAAEGSQGMGVSSGQVALTISDADTDGSNVWCQVYMKPILYSGMPDSDLAGTNAAAFCVTTDGDLLAYSSNAWTNVGSVPTNQWLGFAVHLDYANSNWDIYVFSNASYYKQGRLFTKMNDTPMGFNTNSPAKSEFVQMVVTNGSTDSTYLDALAVSLGVSNCAATLMNVVGVDRLANQTFMSGTPPYDYGDQSLTAGKELSLALSRNLDGTNDTLASADQFRFMDSTAGWSWYSLNASEDWEWQAGALPANARLYPGTALWMQRKGTRDAATFYPYVSEPSYTDTTIYGTNNGTHKGWNFLAWPYTRQDRSVNAGAGQLGLTEGAGCKIYIYEDNRYIKLWWNTGANAWYQGRSPSTYVLKTGQGFWFYRNMDGTQAGGWDPP